MKKKENLRKQLYMIQGRIKYRIFPENKAGAPQMQKALKSLRFQGFLLVGEGGFEAL